MSSGRLLKECSTAAAEPNAAGDAKCSMPNSYDARCTEMRARTAEIVQGKLDEGYACRLFAELLLLDPALGRIFQRAHLFNTAPTLHRAARQRLFLVSDLHTDDGSPVDGLAVFSGCLFGRHGLHFRYTTKLIDKLLSIWEAGSVSNHNDPLDTETRKAFARSLKLHLQDMKVTVARMLCWNGGRGGRTEYPSKFLCTLMDAKMMAEDPTDWAPCRITRIVLRGGKNLEELNIQKELETLPFLPKLKTDCSTDLLTNFLSDLATSMSDTWTTLQNLQELKCFSQGEFRAVNLLSSAQANKFWGQFPKLEPTMIYFVGEVMAQHTVWKALTSSFCSEDFKALELEMTLSIPSVGYPQLDRCPKGGEKILGSGYTLLLSTIKSVEHRFGAAARDILQNMLKTVEGIARAVRNEYWREVISVVISAQVRLFRDVFEVFTLEEPSKPSSLPENLENVCGKGYSYRVLYKALSERDETFGACLLLYAALNKCCVFCSSDAFLRNLMVVPAAVTQIWHAAFPTMLEGELLQKTVARVKARTTVLCNKSMRDISLISPPLMVSANSNKRSAKQAKALADTASPLTSGDGSSSPELSGQPFELRKFVTPSPSEPHQKKRRVGN